MMADAIEGAAAGEAAGCAPANSGRHAANRPLAAQRGRGRRDKHEVVRRLAPDRRWRGLRRDAALDGAGGAERPRPNHRRPLGPDGAIEAGGASRRWRDELFGRWRRHDRDRRLRGFRHGGGRSRHRHLRRTPPAAASLEPAASAERTQSIPTSNVTPTRSSITAPAARDRRNAVAGAVSDRNRGKAAFDVSQLRRIRTQLARFLERDPRSDRVARWRSHDSWLSSSAWNRRSWMRCSKPSHDCSFTPDGTYRPFGPCDIPIQLGDYRRHGHRCNSRAAVMWRRSVRFCGQTRKDCRRSRSARGDQRQRESQFVARTTRGRDESRGPRCRAGST